MAKRYDPISRRLIEEQEQPIYIQRGYATLRSRIQALEQRPTSSGGSFSVPELTSDPVSPQPGDMWILKTTTGGSGGGTLKMLFGLGMPITTTGAATTTYRLCYRTSEGTTIRVTMA